MSLEGLTSEDFRRKIAGLIDPAVSHGQSKDLAKKDAIDYCIIMAKLFGEELDRLTLWERISNGIIASSSKCNGDIESFITLTLEFIKADKGKAACNKDLVDFVLKADNANEEWVSSFLQIMTNKTILIVLKARDLWNSNKKEVKNGE